MVKKQPDKLQDAPRLSREDRLKSALKANMARRKAQALARRDQNAVSTEAKDED